MNADQFRQVQELFLRLRSADESARAPVLAQADEEVREEVMSLLKAGEECGSFLESDATSWSKLTSLMAGTVEHPSASPFPRKVGKYRLLQQIGEGGHGTVFMAEQKESIDRKVAVKLIKPGMDSKQVLARFFAERQALALMDHPSIARVIDAGATDRGSPYFVMELVKGVPIHQFCEENRLSLEERLSLFLQVCQAVHHAHQKGVIHRDLKPSNILVTMGEASPIAKIIDFGIAKALDARLTRETLFTEYGTMLGTLEYMSPEQAEMSAVDIDTRADVYSLGVVLYELLTGATPISKNDILKQGMFEVPRMIRETDPETPSSRITSQQRQVSRANSQPVGILGLQQGDLDWIVMQAIAKDRRRRYESALDLSRDIERFLSDEAVEAHPPSWIYEATKWIRRNRVVAISASLVATSVLLGLLGLASGIYQARQERDLAMDAKTDANRSARQLQENMYSELVESGFRAARTHNAARARKLLDSCLPEMRGWEWDFANRQIAEQSHELLRKLGESAVSNMGFCPTTNQLVCTLENGKVEVWDLESETKTKSIRVESDASIAKFADNGDSLLIGSAGRVTRIDNQGLRKQTDVALGGVYDIAVSRDQQVAAVCTGGGWVATLSLPDLNPIEQWKLPCRLSNIAFGGPTNLVSTGVDGNLYVMTVGRKGHESEFVSDAGLRGCQSMGDGVFATVSGGRLLLTDSSDPKSVAQEIIAGQSGIQSFTLDANGRFLAGCGDGTLVVAGNGTPQQIVANFASAITGLITTANADEFIVALSDGRLLKTDLMDSEFGWSFDAKRITGGLLLAKQGLAIGVDDNGCLQAFDISSGERRVKKQIHDGAVWSISCSDDETVLATMGEDQFLRCWTAPSLELRFEVKTDWGVREICVSSDGAWTAAAPPAGEPFGQREGDIQIWDNHSGKPLQTLVGHTNWVLGMIRTHDGKYLVSSCENRETRIWNLRTGESKLIVPEQRPPAEHLRLSPSGARLFLGHRDGWVTTWSFPGGKREKIWPAFGDRLTGLEAVGNHKVVATSRSSELARVHDFLQEGNLAEFDLGVGYLRDFRLSTDKRAASFTGSDGRVHVQHTTSSASPSH